MRGQTAQKTIGQLWLTGNGYNNYSERSVDEPMRTAKRGRRTSCRGNILHLVGLLLMLGVIAASCHRESQIESTIFCDDFDGTHCNALQTAERTYRFTIPRHKLNSWFDFGYYMYFHSRQTPGIRIVIEPPLSGEQLSAFRSGLECRYRLSQGGHSIEGELEGKRVDPDGGGFWCFDYLGSKLVDFQKQHGDVRAVPSPDFFPVEWSFIYHSPIEAIAGEQTARIRLEWQPVDR